MVVTTSDDAWKIETRWDLKEVTVVNDPELARDNSTKEQGVCDCRACEWTDEGTWFVSYPDGTCTHMLRGYCWRCGQELLKDGFTA
jgi:hypothetical protein